MFYYEKLRLDAIYIVEPSINVTLTFPYLAQFLSLFPYCKWIVVS